MEDLVKELGFDSVAEYHKLVAAADISTPEKMADFQIWKNEDGSKEGLLKLIPNDNK